MNILICMIYIYQSFLSFYICIFDKIHYICFNESCIHCLVFEAKMVEDKPFPVYFQKLPYRNVVVAAYWTSKLLKRPMQI